MYFPSGQTFGLKTGLAFGLLSALYQFCSIPSLMVTTRLVLCVLNAEDVCFITEKVTVPVSSPALQHIPTTPNSSSLLTLVNDRTRRQGFRTFTGGGRFSFSASSAPPWASS
jgi:hypothetical protein